MPNAPEVRKQRKMTMKSFLVKVVAWLKLPLVFPRIAPLLLYSNATRDLGFDCWAGRWLAPY